MSDGFESPEGVASPQAMGERIEQPSDVVPLGEDGMPKK